MSNETVKVFAPCTRLDPHTGEVDVFDAAWIVNAAKRAKERAEAGQAIPVTIGNNGPDKPAPVVGYLNGVLVNAAGELVGVLDLTPEAAERIRAGQLAYRSVEIADSEVVSLALHETDVVAYQLQIGDKIVARKEPPA